MELLQKPDMFWKQALWTDEVKIKLFGHNRQVCFWRRKTAAFHEQNILPTVKRWGWIYHCVVLQPVGQEASHRWRQKKEFH